MNRSPVPPASSKPAPRQRAASGRSIWSKLAILVFILPAAAVMLPTTLVIAAMMLPTIAAFVIDRVPGRALAVSVGMLNGAGSIPAVVDLWSNGHDLLAAQWVLANEIVWLWAYAAAALGWTIFLSLPPLLRRYYSFATQSRIRGLQRRQEQLRKDWGESVTGGLGSSPVDEDGEDDGKAETPAAAPQQAAKSGQAKAAGPKTSAGTA